MMMQGLAFLYKSCIAINLARNHFDMLATYVPHGHFEYSKRQDHKGEYFRRPSLKLLPDPLPIVLDKVLSSKPASWWHVWRQ